MGAAPGSGWEEGEFDFKLVFEEEPPVRAAEPEGEDSPSSSSSRLGQNRLLGNVTAEPARARKRAGSAVLVLCAVCIRERARAPARPDLRAAPRLHVFLISCACEQS